MQKYKLLQERNSSHLSCILAARFQDHRDTCVDRGSTLHSDHSCIQFPYVVVLGSLRPWRRYNFVHPDGVFPVIDGVGPVGNCCKIRRWSSKRTLWHIKIQPLKAGSTDRLEEVVPAIMVAYTAGIVKTSKSAFVRLHTGLKCSYSPFARGELEALEARKIGMLDCKKQRVSEAPDLSSSQASRMPVPERDEWSGARAIDQRLLERAQ